MQPAPSVPGDWWRTFFTGVSVDLWLQAVPEEVTRREIDFIVSVLGVSPPAKLLDVPCGGGRHTIPLAEKGFPVTAVDLSADFLRAARARSDGRNLPVEWHEQDMRNLPWTAHFDGALCAGNSFGYLDDAGNADFLKAVGRTLKPGAKFLIDTGVLAETILAHFPDRKWYQVGDIHFLIHNRHNLAQSRLDTDLTFIRNGQVDRRPITQRIYTYRELCGLLETAGFGGFEAFASLEKEPYRLGASRGLVVATRI